MKKKVVSVTYTFDIEYEHPEHLEIIKKNLIKEPVFDMRGAGPASDDVFYSYHCKRRKKGKIV